MPILRGLDGVKKMGKSLGNYIGVGEPAKDQFGKAMSISDDLMAEWFTLLTDRPPGDISRLTNAAANMETTLIHPMEAKKMLARDIVAAYHGRDAAIASQAEWEKQFSQKQDPDEVPEVSLSAADLQDGKIGILRLLNSLQLAKSNNEARQKVLEGRGHDWSGSIEDQRPQSERGRDGRVDRSPRKSANRKDQAGLIIPDAPTHIAFVYCTLHQPGGSPRSVIGVVVFPFSRPRGGGSQ